MSPVVADGDFAAEALSQAAWDRVADELIFSASQLAPAISAWWRAIDHRFHDPSATIPEQNGLRVYLMLIGFAIENVAKGVLVAELSEQERENLVGKRRLPESIKSHNLSDLVLAIGFELDWLDEMTLSYLEAATVWHGRYPVPLHADRYYAHTLRNGERVGTDLRGSSDHDYAMELFQRVRAHARERKPKS